MKKILLLVLLFSACYNPNSKKDGCGKWNIAGTNDDNWTTDVKIESADSVIWVDPKHIKVFIDGKGTNVFAERIKVERFKCK